MSATDTAERQPIRIMSVEDDELSFRVLERMVVQDSELEFELQWVTNIDEAASRLRSSEFDLCFIDHDLGSENGFELIERLPSKDSMTPCILLTGKDDDSLGDKALEFGFYDYLVKGKVDAPSLRRAIRYALDRHRTEEKLRNMALRDPLTGLHNRAAFSDLVENVLAQGARSGNTCGVLYVDLDRYKAINDMIGHHAGDQVLIEVARRLRGLLRQSDVLARMGGDEFTVCCSRVAGTGDLVTIARKMIYEITQPIEFENQDLYIGASIGIAASQDGLADAETLVRAADLAMYEAKRSGRGGYVVHSEAQSEKVAREVAVERALRRSLEENRLTLAYQPIFNIRDRRIHSLEVLARWTDPNLGEVAPDEFIALAERTGLIGDLGAYVMQRACLDLQLIVENAVLRDSRISLNLSVHQLGNPAFLYDIRSLLDEMGVPADVVEFEVTEGVFEYGEELLTDRLKVLKALGASISVDDFGTGYSSLARLRDYPVDSFKIDRTFVGEIEADPAAWELCAAIIALGAALRLDVVAEGVETVGQLHALREAGCHLIQGYLLCRPIPRDELLALSYPDLADGSRVT